MISLKERLREGRKTAVDWDQIHRFSPAMAYVLGLLWADGHVRISRGEISLIAASRDMRYYRTILEKVGVWSIGRVKRYKKSHHLRSVACIHCREFADWLCERGYKTKSNQSADLILKSIPTHLHIYWFSGLMDGDGTVAHRNLSINISSAFDQNWLFFLEFLRNNDIQGNVCRVRGKNSSGSTVYLNRYHAYRFAKLLEAAKYRLPRKSKKAKELVRIVGKKIKMRIRNLGIRRRRIGCFVVHAPNLQTGRTFHLAQTETYEEAIMLRDFYYLSNNVPIDEPFRKNLRDEIHKVKN